MKKILLCLAVVCLLIVGCKSNEDNKKEEITGGWDIVLSNQVSDMEEETINIFNNAKAKYTESNLDLVALFGKQVVAGTNYMYLAKSESTYKVVVVYHDLEGNNTITKVSAFDLGKYVNKNIDGLNEQLSGGWNVESSGRPYGLFEDGENNVFEKATSTLTGMSYKPLVIVGKQIVAGTNYAVICYGSATVPDAKEGIYLLTLYEDLDGNGKLLSSAYIDLAEFNK